MKVVALKNGTQAPASAVIMIMTSLRLLAATDPSALCELAALCRDEDHQLWGDSAEDLTRLGLLPLHDVTRDVVLSAVTGDPPDLSLGSPLAAVSA